MLDRLREILRHVWGYDDFRPLQAEAMQAVLDRRDSVVVLPTGGGKSICFQAPAMLMPGLAVVVSPLISLMKDQVDALSNCGVPAAFLNSTSSPEERRKAVAEIHAGRLKLLYLSPERLTTEQTRSFLRQIDLSFFAIDEAHCISDWGHDFRPEYRALQTLKSEFPNTAIHAYTATATARVRDDIVAQLALANAQVLVGPFDRPNLTYRVARRGDLMSQLNEVLQRHPDESGIIYCIRRRDVETICEALRADGRSALPYHAGLSDEERRKNQESFSSDKARIIVATVAFGMGIDKPDVRFVIHVASPKSLEHYQQETGRAGRDGLDAECCLFYSPADFVTWRKLQGDSAPSTSALLAGIEQFCISMRCRHRAISEYFGQTLAAENCSECDTCLDEIALVDDALVLAQKILSCVARLRQGYGAAYVGRVLVGSRDKRILEQAHDRLSTHGILSENQRGDIRMWIEQLIAQECLKVAGEFRVLELTALGMQVLRGEFTPQLTKAAGRSRARSDRTDSWDGVDRDLFEQLRTWRRSKATQRCVAPFMILGDAALRDLALRRPSTAKRLLEVFGIGDKRAADYGNELLALIVEHCRQSDVAVDVHSAAPRAGARADTAKQTIGGKPQAFPLFAMQKSIEEVMQSLGRARATVVEYLSEYIEQEQVFDTSPWLDIEVLNRVREASQEVGMERLKPLYEALDATVSYEQLRIATACLRNEAEANSRSA